MAAVVAGREGRLGRVLALEHPRGVGHAHEEAGLRLAGAGDQVPAGFLLQHVVDHRERRDRAGGHRGQALVPPADLGAQRHPVAAHLALGNEVLERREQLVRADRVHARVVELVHVDAVGAEALQAALARVPHEVRSPVVGQLPLAARSGVRVPVVADLGRVHDLVAPPLERLREQRLPAPVAVGVGRVEERDAPVERRPQQLDGLAVVLLAPPSGGQRPHPEAHLGDADVGAGKGAVAHRTRSSRSG